MSSRTVATFVFALTCLSLTAGTHAPAAACGHCEEDLVAATYDYGVLTRAVGQRHIVVYTRLLGPAAGASPSLKTAVARTLASTAGVDAGTVRVSLDPPAAAFACDSRQATPQLLIRRMNRGLAARGLRLQVIRIDSRLRPAPRVELAAAAAARTR